MDCPSKKVVSLFDELIVEAAHAVGGIAIGRVKGAVLQMSFYQKSTPVDAAKTFLRLIASGTTLREIEQRCKTNRG